MRHFDKHRLQTEPRAGLSASVWSLAALSAAACLCSVLGAKTLSNMFEQGDPPVLAFSRGGADAAMRRLAKSAPQAEAPQSVTIVRSLGVDGVTTATIPHKPGMTPALTLTPCGDAAK